jgi:hypothetical protein
MRVRLTLSQIAMLELLGASLPFVHGEMALKERIRKGRANLVSITGRDFGFEPQRWHDYLRETGASGYRWSNKHLGMPKRIAEAVRDPAWRHAVEDLRDDT